MRSCRPESPARPSSSLRSTPSRGGFSASDDRYFAIADGTLEVLRDGARLNTLERGEGFGEIALLHDVPRTATVRAATDGRLFAIERDAFLIALTGHAPTRARVEQVAEERRSATSQPSADR